jgi:hypothetical protein
MYTKSFKSTTAEHEKYHEELCPNHSRGRAGCWEKVRERAWSSPVEQMQTFLGYSQLETTQMYAESSMEMLRERDQRALSRCGGRSVRVIGEDAAFEQAHGTCYKRWRALLRAPRRDLCLLRCHAAGSRHRRRA